MNRLTIPIANGSDPEVIDTEDRTTPSLAYGEDLEIDDFGEIVVFCESPDAPGGTCEYNAVALDPTLCKHCGKRTG
jgi:hypothetical protein